MMMPPPPLLHPTPHPTPYLPPLPPPSTPTPPPPSSQLRPPRVRKATSACPTSRARLNRSSALSAVLASLRPFAPEARYEKSLCTRKTRSRRKKPQASSTREAAQASTPKPAALSTSASRKGPSLLAVVSTSPHLAKQMAFANLPLCSTPPTTTTTSA